MKLPSFPKKNTSVRMQVFGLKETEASEISGTVRLVNFKTALFWHS